MQKITPCLWFDQQAEEAARFYVSVFPNSRLGKISHYGDGAPLPKGTVLTVTFELDGQEFMALNGGPTFHFSEAVSFVVNCADQAELDAMWDKLAAGGQEVQCGWLKDRFGLSWQVVPTELQAMLTSGDTAGAERVFTAIGDMVKLDLAKLRRAFQGQP